MQTRPWGQPLLALALMLAAQAGSAAAASDEISIGRKSSIQSEILQEKREYWVYLPPAYNDPLRGPVRYPVMYILDGDTHFHSASGVLNFMSEANSQIPRMIMVAIPNTDRMRDLSPTHSTTDMQGKNLKPFEASGGGERFLKFIETELIPRIEADYRTAPHRTFVGHSLGGLTVLYSLLTQPGLFQGYIAIDSSLWWQDQFMVDRLQKSASAVTDERTRIFMSVGDHRTTGEYEGSKMLLGNLRFGELLQQRYNTRAKLQHFSGEDHGSVPLPTLYYGLLHLFEGYKVDQQVYFDDSTAPLIAHFKSASSRLGFEVLPSESLVDQLGHGAYTFFEKGPLAIEYLTLNIVNYPTSSHALSSIAALYKEMGDMQQARNYYTRALRVNAKNADAKASLKALDTPKQ